MFEVTPPSSDAQGELRAIATVGDRKISVGHGRHLLSAHSDADSVPPLRDQAGPRRYPDAVSNNIGYIVGAGDEVPDALRQMGANVTLLSADDLSAGDLSQYDAIVTGVRACNVRADLARQLSAPVRLRAERRHAHRPVQRARRRTVRRRPVSARAHRPVPHHDQPRSRDRGRRAGDLSESRRIRCLHIAERNYRSRFRRLGAGARLEFRERMGPAISDRARMPRPRRRAALRAASSTRATERACTFSPPTPGSANCPPASPARIVCLPTCSSRQSSHQVDSMTDDQPKSPHEIAGRAAADPGHLAARLRVHADLSRRRHLRRSTSSRSTSPHDTPSIGWSCSPG